MDTKIKEFGLEYPDWSVEEGKLVARFQFESFYVVEDVVQNIMSIAEEQNHHPEVTFGYSTVEVKTSTHDAGGQITEKDLDLAKAISESIQE